MGDDKELNKDFYKYIIYEEGLYKIRRNNEIYNAFTKLTDALDERDCLIRAKWDWDNLCSQETDFEKNKYKDMELPEDMRNIYREDDKWIIRKTINGKHKRFGKSKDLKEILRRREKLRLNGWNKQEL